MTAYTPTEADKLTGARLRQLRKRRGETIVQMIQNSGVGLKQSSISRVELGERPLTEIEAAKLAAHFNVAVSQLIQEPRLSAIDDVKAIIGSAWPIETEQAWLGNEDPKPALFAVPGPDKADVAKSGDVVGPTPDTMLIDLREPLTPEQYRDQVWVPYLEARYAADQQKTA
jgi:transcriptional regulator with XRE-family HTH domain